MSFGTNNCYKHLIGICCLYLACDFWAPVQHQEFCDLVE